MKNLYRVAWIVQEVKEEWIEAESIDDAKAKWEDEPDYSDNRKLFFIEDEDGNQTIYD